MAKISAGHHIKMTNVMQHKKYEDVRTNLAILACKVGIVCEAEQYDHFADIFMIYILFFGVCEITNSSNVSREMTAEMSARHRDNMQAAKQQKYYPHIGNNLVILPWKEGIPFELCHLEFGYRWAA